MHGNTSPTVIVLTLTGPQTHSYLLHFNREKFCCIVFFLLYNTPILTNFLLSYDPYFPSYPITSCLTPPQERVVFPDHFDGLVAN